MERCGGTQDAPELLLDLLFRLVCLIAHVEVASSSDLSIGSFESLGAWLGPSSRSASDLGELARSLGSVSRADPGKCRHYLRGQVRKPAGLSSLAFCSALLYLVRIRRQSLRRRV